MRHYTFYIILIYLALVSTKLLGQTDSLILYDPYTLTKTDIIINYDTTVSIEETISSVGDFENKTNLELILPDSVQNRFTYNNLAFDALDMKSYPIRTNIALHLNRFYGDYDYYKASGSGILVSPNAVLTAGHVIGYEATNINTGIYFKWRDSLYVTPSLQDGYPQSQIGSIKVKKCYVFKRFVNALGHAIYDDLALLILDKPIGYEIGWLGIGYTPSDSFLLDNVFYNFSYPGTDGYDGLNMYYKYGQFSNVNTNLSTASNGITGISGESGSGFFYTDNTKYTAYGIRTYSSLYTLITKDKFHIFEKLIDDNLVSSIEKLPETSSQMLIFPNPATDFINIKLKNSSDIILCFLVYNLQGQIIINRTNVIKDENINISNLQSGLYIVEIRTISGKFINKLIVK